MNRETTVRCMDPDNYVLGGTDAYAEYFALLRQVFTRLKDWHQANTTQGHPENETIRTFLDRLLQTIVSLRMKNLWSDDHSLLVDLTESGFPNHYEILRLENDLAVREERLAAHASEQVAKERILEHIFEYGSEPQSLLKGLAERTYFAELAADRLFTQYTPGKLYRIGTNERESRYLVTWGCYDAESNRPYLYLLYFERDSGKLPLEDDAQAHAVLMDVIRSEGSRAPQLGVVAFGVDNAIEDVHPKILKRICIGPFHSALTQDPHPIGELIRSDAELAGEFALEFTDEIVFSIREEKTSGLFSKGKIRQVFFIPEIDDELFRRKASKVYKYMLASHRLIQQMDITANPVFEGFRKHQLITVGTGGVIHGK